MSWIEQQIDRLMRGQPAGFKEVLTTALASPSELPTAIEALEEVLLESAEEARLTLEVVGHLPLPVTEGWVSPLHTVMAWLEDAEGGAAEVLHHEGAGPLLRVHDRLLHRLDIFHEDPVALSSDVMAVMRVMVLYRVPGTIERLVAAGHHPILQDAYFWGAVFEVLDDDEHPWRLDVVDAFATRWPGGAALGAFLDHVNGLVLDDVLTRHSFDTPRGHGALEAWLTSDDMTDAARSATVALPFVRVDVRRRLLTMAEAHSDIAVRIEAAAVRSEEGDPVGIERLKSWAEDPRFAETAINHLERLGALDAVPAIVEQRDFRAAAAMASWLAQPTEFNRPPDDLVTVDTRELHWPPTEDRRRVWLFRYRYSSNSPDTSFEGLGMVGSVTFAMADEDTEAPHRARSLRSALCVGARDDGRPACPARSEIRKPACESCAKRRTPTSKRIGQLDRSEP